MEAAVKNFLCRSPGKWEESDREAARRMIEVMEKHNTAQRNQAEDWRKLKEISASENVRLWKTYVNLHEKIKDLEIENGELKEKIERVVRIIKEINDKFPLDELRKMYPQSDPPLIPCPGPYPLYPYPWHGVVPPWWMYPPIITWTSKDTTGAKPE